MVKIRTQEPGNLVAPRPWLPKRPQRVCAGTWRGPPSAPLLLRDRLYLTCT